MFITLINRKDPDLLVDAFFIIGTPKESEFVVGPSGCQYVHRTDNRIRLEFPEGSVKESNTFKITVWLFFIV